MVIFSISFLVLLSFHQLSAAPGCILDVQSLWQEKNANIPLLVDTATNSIINPVMAANKRVINLIQNQRVKVVCAGDGNKFKSTDAKLLNKASVDATCGGPSTIIVNKAAFTYPQLGCDKQNKEKVKETGKTCMNTSPAIGSLIQIGWEFDSSFISIYEVCFDKKSMGNLYSKHVIDGKSVGANFSPRTEGTWGALSYYGTTGVDNKYGQTSQASTMKDVLGDTKTVDNYFHLNDGNKAPQDFLTKGHLAPGADFVDLASQQSTYYYINAAPQFQSLNGANWRLLENAVLNVAGKNSLKLTVYTGTHGNLQLKDNNNKLQNINLYFDKQSQNAKIPVPLYFWKVVYDPVSKKGTAFVGVNYPTKLTIRPTPVFCTDQWKNIGFVNTMKKPTDIANGYLFACTVDDLFKKIGKPADFPTVSGLFNP